jgi:hypothetical protein
MRHLQLNIRYGLNEYKKRLKLYKKRLFDSKIIDIRKETIRNSNSKRKPIKQKCSR